MAWVAGTLQRHRSMLDSHRLAPHPELTLRIFGEVVGQQGRRGRGGSGQDRTGRDWLTLAQKQHGRPRERVGGRKQLPADPPCPLGRAQTSKWSLPNLL